MMTCRMDTVLIIVDKCNRCSSWHAESVPDRVGANLTRAVELERGGEGRAPLCAAAHVSSSRENNHQRTRRSFAQAARTGQSVCVL